MERETGFEPATSSLGISASIAYKGHGVHSGDTDPWSFSNLPPLLPQQPLNGVEMEWKNRAREQSPTCHHHCTPTGSVEPVDQLPCHPQPGVLFLVLRNYRRR